MERVTKSNIAMGKPAPVLIGLALDEQIIESVPTEPHDRYDRYINLLSLYTPLVYNHSVIHCMFVGYWI